MTEPTPKIFDVFVNHKWHLNLPEHRAERVEWTNELGWEPERLDAMHTVIKKGDVVYDIGTEEGDMTALFAKWGADVVLFEPNPLVWSNIRCIWEANKLPLPIGYFVGFASNETNLKPVDLEAIIAEPERDGYPACAYGPIIREHGFRNVSERFNDTPQIKLDDYYKQTKIAPTIITMDVEGAEFEVLLGAKNIIKKFSPTIYISLHPIPMWDMFGTASGKVHNFLRDLGYEGRFLAYDHEEHWEYERVKK